MIEIHNFNEGTRSERVTEALKAVSANKRWLDDVRPATAQRYKNVDQGRSSVQKVINHNGLEGFTLVLDSEPVGMATLIEKLRIIRPGTRLRQLEARELDYWTVADVSETHHREIVDKLSLYGAYRGNVLGLLTAAEEERALGIPLQMDKLGEPGQIRLPFGTPDRFGLTRIEEPVQAYINAVPNPLMA